MAAAGCASAVAEGRFDPGLAVLVSDLHINGEKPSHTTAELKKTVASLLALRPLPAHVVMMGDVADTHGKACDYKAADPLMRPLEDAGIAVDWVMGNHDHRAAFADFRPDYAKTTLVPGRQVHVVSLPSFDLVLMDSLVESPGEGSFNEVDGEVDGGQLEWLADYGAKAKRPFVVCAHHDGRQMKSFAKAAILSSPKMCGYLHGHRHSWMPDALHAWGKDARLVRSAGIPSAAAWGDIGYALLRDCGDSAEITAVIRDCWFPRPPSTEATRRIAKENDGMRLVFKF